jgi:hypothetical protein
MRKRLYRKLILRIISRVWQTSRTTRMSTLKTESFFITKHVVFSLPPLVEVLEIFSFDFLLVRKNGLAHRPVVLNHGVASFFWCVAKSFQTLTLSFWFMNLVLVYTKQ